jgi:hypothetical protein
MPLFQMVECLVAVGGDTNNVVHRGDSNPITYPELLLFQYVHGDDAVTDAYELGMEERDNNAELDRLRRTYGPAAVQDVFPGSKPRLPLRDARIGARLAPSKPKRRVAPSRLDPDDGMTDQVPADPGDVDTLRDGE